MPMRKLKTTHERRAFCPSVKLKYYRTGINKSIFNFMGKKIPYGNKNINKHDMDPIDLARFRTHFFDVSRITKLEVHKDGRPERNSKRVAKRGFNEDQWGVTLRMK